MSEERRVYRHSPVQMRNFDTGEVKSYGTVLELADEIGKDIEQVIVQIARGPNWLTHERRQYRLDEGDAPWPTHPDSRFILVLDTFTGVESRHQSQFVVASLVGVTNITISDRILKKTSGLLKKRYAVKAESDPRSWNEIIEKPLKDVNKKIREYIDLKNSSQHKFKRLDEFPGIRIYEDGRIVRDIDGLILGTHNADGYMTCCVDDANGQKVGIGNHRLVAMAYHGIPENYKELQVNHINFIRDCNEASNLEWVSQYENSKHSGYNNPEGGIRFKPIQIRDFDTKEVMQFDTMLACSQYLGVGKDGVQEKANRGDGILYEDRRQYRLLSDAPWCETPRSLFVKSMDIMTGEERTFKDCATLCESLGVLAGVVSTSLNKGIPKVVDGKYILKYETDQSPWPDISDPIRFLAENTALTPIVAFNPTTNDRKVFLSAADCARTMGVKTNTLGMRLKSGKPEQVYAEGYRYDYYCPDIQ